MDEWDFIPLSRLSHAGYCLRRAALLTNEQLWSENADTAKGRLEHERVHDERIEHRGSSIRLYEYTVYSESLGISGKCDCIEAERDETGCRIPAADFPVRLYPVEFKHGKLRTEEEYEIQLCAQAMCLEEMYGAHISEGAILYQSSHRRQTVQFTDALREKVYKIIQVLDESRKNFTVPSAEPSSKCIRCSMCELCLPELSRTAKGYCQRLADEAKGVGSCEKTAGNALYLDA